MEWTRAEPGPAAARHPAGHHRTLPHQQPWPQCAGASAVALADRQERTLVPALHRSAAPRHRRRVIHLFLEGLALALERYRGGTWQSQGPPGTPLLAAGLRNRARGIAGPV